MKVSVIIPAYNAERWLPETLASVAAQEWPDLEVIVVDDGSTDGTAALVEKLYPQWTLHRSENRGVSHARNLGTQLAAGDLINYLDADDLLLPGKLKRQVALIESSGADVVYGDWQVLEEMEGRGFERTREVRRTWQSVNADAEIAFFNGMWCPTGAYLYRRAFLDKALPWKDWLPVIQDARFGFDCAHAGAVWAHDAEVGTLYRQHRSGSVSTRNRLAFLRDCHASAKDIERLWRSTPGAWTPQREDAMVEVLTSLSRGAHRVDESLFEDLCAHLEALRPDFKPQGPRLLRWLSTLVGYRFAVRLADAVHALRQRRSPTPSMAF